MFLRISFSRFCLFPSLLVLLTGWSPAVQAGFLEMPEITEMPELQRKSMLKDLDIPSVRDRDPDPEAGPRLNVEKFKLQGIVEYPELGITKKDVEDLIEGIRYDLMQEYKVLDSGFTKTELEEVSNLLVEIEEDTMDRHVTDLEVQKLVWLIREQRSNRGITLGTIETVADRITQFYRERGFILAKAYIPQQEVRDGVVTLTLLLGTLGEVNVSGNNLYESEYLTSVFDDMLTQPVTSAEVEERLYLINDFPGILTTGFFQAGSQVGDTRLNLNVVSEKNYDVNVRMDNHGSEQTGLYRLYAEGLWHNPLGYADQLQVAALMAAKPSNTLYGQMRYSFRVLSPRFTVSMGAATNDFVLGPGNSESVNDLQLSGVTLQQDINLSYRFKRSRVENYYGELLTEKVTSEIRLGALPGEGDVGLDDTIKNNALVFRFDVLSEASKILHQGDIKLTSGQFLKGAEVGQDEKYNIFDMNYTLLTFWKLPYFESTTRVIYRTSLQYTPTPLSSISQFSLAGPTRTRAYPVNQFSADNAVYMGLDWIFDAPAFFDMNIGDSNLKKMTRPFVFADASWGEVISLVEDKENSTAELANIGFGFQFSYTNNIKGNLLFAFPMKEKFSSLDISVPDDNFRLIFDFQYSLR